MLLHRPCPGCGLTTSFSATVHGDFVHAFQAHPFGPIWYIAFTISALACLYGYVRLVRFNTDSAKFNWTLAGLTILYLAFSAYRFAVEDNYTAFGRSDKAISAVEHGRQTAGVPKQDPTP